MKDSSKRLTAAMCCGFILEFASNYICCRMICIMRINVTILRSGFTYFGFSFSATRTPICAPVKEPNSKQSVVGREHDHWGDTLWRHRNSWKRWLVAHIPQPGYRQLLKIRTAASLTSLARDRTGHHKSRYHITRGSKYSLGLRNVDSKTGLFWWTKW